MFENWLEDQKDTVELAKNHAYLLGSFWDPKAVQDMMGTSGNVIVSSEEEFEKSTQMVAQDREQKMANSSKRRRRRVKG